MHLNRKATRDLLTQINAPPAHHLIRLRIRTVDNQVPQLRHLCLTQLRLRASADPRAKPRQALGIVPMNPVTQRLPLHTAHLRRFPPRVALQDQRNGKKPPDNLPVLVLRHQTPQIRRRICQIRHCNRARHRPASLPKQQRPANHNSPRRRKPTRVKNRGGWYNTSARKPRRLFHLARVAGEVAERNDVGERGAHGTTLIWPCLARQPIPHSGSGVYPLSIERSACETCHFAVQLRCLSLRVPGGHADRPWLVDARLPRAAALWLVVMSLVLYGWWNPWFAPRWPDPSGKTTRSLAGSRPPTNSRPVSAGLRWPVSRPISQRLASTNTSTGRSACRTRLGF